MIYRHLIPVCAAEVGIVLLAGCGGSSANIRPTATPSTASSSSSPVASPPASESTPSESTPSDQTRADQTRAHPTRAQLEGILLQAADLPPGSEGRPKKPVIDANAEAKLAACAGGQKSVADILADIDSNAVSADFAFPGRGVFVTSSGRGYGSPRSVDDYVAMVQSPKFSQCFAQGIRDGAATDDPFEELAVKITPGSAGGPANVVATGTGTFTSKGAMAVFVSIAFIRGPLMTAEVYANGANGKPVPAAQMESLVGAVAERAAKG